MCSGGAFLASFTAGTQERPRVPDVVEPCLTTTPDGLWVVWARKVARTWGDEFMPITGSGSYPADAVAECRRNPGHAPPLHSCSCGFHALSERWMPFPPGVGFVHLEVALSGRVLAFEWSGGGVLFRAARQTVMRVSEPQDRRLRLPPEEPGGRLARLVGRNPRDAGSCRLSVPAERAPVVSLVDDAGYCIVDATTGVTFASTGVLASV